MKLGRPTEYRPDWMPQKAVDLMSEGASKTEVAAELGVDKATLYRWIEQHEDFRDAIKKGEGLCEAWWERNGRKGLREEKFNATLWYMNMKNRFRWTDRQEQKIDATISPAQEIEKANARAKKADKE